MMCSRNELKRMTEQLDNWYLLFDQQAATKYLVESSLDNIIENIAATKHTIKQICDDTKTPLPAEYYKSDPDKNNIKRIGHSKSRKLKR